MYDRLPRDRYGRISCTCEPTSPGQFLPYGSSDLIRQQDIGDVVDRGEEV